MPLFTKKISVYNSNQTNHVNRMLRNRLTRIFLITPEDRRNPERSIKKLIDSWNETGMDQNGSSPWKLHGDILVKFIQIFGLYLIIFWWR